MSEICYSGNDTGKGYYKVTFLVNASRVKLTRSFDSPHLAKKFVNKLRHSTRCTLVSSPLFN